MSERVPCTYCKGHGWNWQLPHGVNAFAIGANGIAKISRKITCHCCLGAGTVPLPDPLPIQKERT